MAPRSKARFVTRKIEEDFERLKNGKYEEKILAKHIQHALDSIEENCFCGIQVKKRLIPKEYLEFGIDNLWKYNLPKGWRLLYSISDGEPIIIAIILEWLPHKDYEKRFRY